MSRIWANHWGSPHVITKGNKKAGGHFDGFPAFLRTITILYCLNVIVISTISGVLPTRIGGPQVP